MARVEAPRIAEPWRVAIDTAIATIECRAQVMLRIKLVLTLLCATLAPACGDDCGDRLDRLLRAYVQAQQCDPFAEVPCSALYNGCVYVGIASSATEYVSAVLAEYQDAGCVEHDQPCPLDLGPPTLVCQADENEVHLCAIAQ